VSITLSGAGWSIALDNPHYDYTVEYHWAIKSEAKKGYYKHWDNGSQYDRFVCKNIKFWVTKAAAETLSELLLDPDYMRISNFTLNLGTTPSGFFPASPRYGDVGNFTVNILSANPTGVMLDQFSHFEYVFTFAIINTPSYTLPVLSSDGLISIDYLTNAFRWPADGFSPSIESGVVKSQANNRTVSHVDTGRNSDGITTSFVCEGSAGNVGHLINYLQSSRGNAITFGAHGNYYPFGAIFTETSYSVRCVNKVFEIQHDRHNNFKIPLTLLKV
jgi:hypothetical protein